MTKNAENRTRVQAGIKTGGQFAPEAHSEPAGVTLTMEPSPLDKAAVGAVADLVRTRAAYETGVWQRRQDKGRYNYEHEPRDPMPEVLIELNRRAHEFETLPCEEQEAVLDELKFPNVKHLLEPGQRLGNDKVQVGDDLGEGGNLGLALTAQKLVADSGMPGDITLTRVGDWAEFKVQDGSIKHVVRIGQNLLSFSADSGDDYDHRRDDWLYRSDISAAGGSVFEQDRAAELRSYHKDHREYAVMMDAVAASSFREAGDELGELNRSARTAELRIDGTEYVLDVSGDEPALKTNDGTDLHPSMVRGFLSHAATKTGHPDGDALAADLREVFRETDRRLIP